MRQDNLVAEDHSSSNEDEDGNGDGDTEYGNEGQDGDDNQEEAANETVNDFDNDTADAPPARRTRQLVMSNTTSAIPSQTPLNDIRVSSSQDQNFSLGKHAADDDTDAQAYGPSKKNKVNHSPPCVVGTDGFYLLVDVTIQLPPLWLQLSDDKSTVSMDACSKSISNLTNIDSIHNFTNSFPFHGGGMCNINHVLRLTLMAIYCRPCVRT
jgi:hypothetical protein